MCVCVYVCVCVCVCVCMCACATCDSAAGRHTLVLGQEVVVVWITASKHKLLTLARAGIVMPARKGGATRADLHWSPTEHWERGDGQDQTHGSHTQQNHWWRSGDPAESSQHVCIKTFYRNHIYSSLLRRAETWWCHHLVLSENITPETIWTSPAWFSFSQ